MGFIKDKVIAPIAGHAAKHTSPELGHKAVNALGADKVSSRGLCKGAVPGNAALQACTMHWCSCLSCEAQQEGRRLLHRAAASCG